MVSNKYAKKAKKPVETTLGKAPINPKGKEADLSHLRKPIKTNISGIKQLLTVFEGATTEVKDLLLYECDIMYECRTCKTIFRSLANFILHKRDFCKEKISPVGYLDNNNVFEIDDPPEPTTIENSPLNKVIQKLRHIEHVRESAKQYLLSDLALESDSNIIKNMDDLEEKASSCSKMIFKPIDSNNSGVFQTLVKASSRNIHEKGEDMKNEVMEIHKKLENDVPVLDSDGKICGFTSSKLHQTALFPTSKFKCTECNNRFATQKSLTNHMKCVHNPSRIIYICPTCKDTFANPWCVYRHLLKVHRMTNKQVRRMREQVHNSWIRRGEEDSILKKKASEVAQNSTDSENQWINDIEGDKDFQMCAGCGKHFERKAALHSHSQMCAKRLEVTNNIKENAKKKEEETAEKGKTDKTSIKGASRRKGQLICSYRRTAKNSSQADEITPSKINYINDESSDDVPKIENQPATLNPTSNTSSNFEDGCLESTMVHKSVEKINSHNQQKVKKNLFAALSEDESTSTSNASSKPVVSDLNLKQEKNDDKAKIECNSSSAKPKVNNICSPDNPLVPASPVTNKNAITKECSEVGPELSLATSTTSKTSLGRSSSCEKTLDSSLNQETIYVSDSDDESPKVNCKLLQNHATRDDDPTSRDYSMPRLSVCVISDGSEGEEDNSLQSSSDLLSNSVSFEAFCEKIGAKSIIENSKVTKRKRKLDTVLGTISSKTNAAVPTEKNDDDVILVEDSKGSPTKEIEDGFAGFSSEETSSRHSFSVNFSTLSYNNPLKSKAIKSDKTHPSDLVEEELLPEDIKNESNFIPRAEPYINRGKLTCIPCNIVFETFVSLLWHMSAHFSWFRFQCSKCSFITFNKTDCLSHAQNHHNVKESDALRFVLPLPNWKTVLMSHEFRLLNNSDDLKGKHTDEQIVIEEECNQERQRVDNFFESESVFENYSQKNLSYTVLEKDNNKKRTKLSKGTIDVQETTHDLHTLPEPLELVIPANYSEIVKTFNSDDDAIVSEDTNEEIDCGAEDPNDDWGLSRFYKFEEPIKIEDVSEEKCPPVINRSCRIRTKVKQNDDFLYYGNGMSSMLKVTDVFKNHPKQRSDSNLPVKPKVSSKSVPTLQKRKS